MVDLSHEITNLWYFESKVGSESKVGRGGGDLLKLSINLELVSHTVMHEVGIMTTVVTFQRNGSFAGYVLLEISCSCVDTMLKGIEATR